MREIKFRAWHKTRKMMLTVVELCLYTQNATLTGAPKRLTTSYSVLELMQYTGLKDKNGAPMFEGDIFRNPITPWSDEEIVEVYWNEENLQWAGRSNESDDELVAFDIDEVIGNIYENPELCNNVQTLINS